MKRSALAGLLSLLVSAFGATAEPALAQDRFPNRALTFIVPLTPGSGADTTTRLVAEEVGKALNVPVVVENKPGADTLIAVQSMLKAPADGHTVLLITPSSVTLGPALNPKLPYDATRDLRPLTASSRGQATFVTAAGSRFGSLQALLDAARSQPGTVSMATYGGHYYRLATELLAHQADVKFNLIPYNSPTQALSDVVGGTVDAMIIDTGAVLPMIDSGKLRPLAVSGVERHAKLPGVPTVRESGLPDYSSYIWIGFAVHGNTPDSEAKVLEAALRQAVHSEAHLAQIRTNGAEVVGNDSAELRQLIATDVQRYTALLEQIGER